jgi:protein-tyrosine phosphatase
MKILMVCLGNICRSPLAEGIFKQKVAEKNLNWYVDSAGTGGWHAGELPDRRSIAIAKKYGIDLTDQRARKLQLIDLERFDLILAMDENNYQDILRLAKTDVQRKKVAKILNFAHPHTDANVPDPYYDNRFELVYDLLDKACDAVIAAYSPPAPKGS